VKMIKSVSEMTAVFRSKEAFLDFIEAPRAPNDEETVGKGRWSNRDLEPTPPEERTWKWYVYCR
jgi:nucleobase:cation symporter-1, NCS1 family